MRLEQKRQKVSALRADGLRAGLFIKLKLSAAEIAFCAIQRFADTGRSGRYSATPNLLFGVW